MIFVTVGMHYQGFERLIKKMDELATRINEEVVIQIGSTNYRPKNAKYFKFIGDEKILEYYKKARVIVSHAGAGTLIVALTLGKPLIVVPRLRKFGECIDNQQLELAEALSKKGKIIVVYDIEKLEEAIRKAERLNSKVERNKKLLFFLKKYLQNLEK